MGKTHPRYFVELMIFRSMYSPAVLEEAKSVGPLQKELLLILKEIRIITEKVKQEDEAAAVEADWKFAAMVIDRLCLIVYTLFTIIASLTVLLTAPHVIVA